jgi:mRNA interferase RelE/StbE
VDEAVSFEIAWTAQARRALVRLPEKVALSSVEFIYGPLAGSPRRVGHPLQYDLEGLHSAHRGDYRVIYLVEDDRQRVTIVTIEHRTDVYRRR